MNNNTFEVIENVCIENVMKITRLLFEEVPHIISNVDDSMVSFNSGSYIFEFSIESKKSTSSLELQQFEDFVSTELEMRQQHSVKIGVTAFIIIRITNGCNRKTFMITLEI